MESETAMKIKDMIKNYKLKLCTIGTFGMIFSAALTGCTSINCVQNQDTNYNITENTTDLSKNKEQAIITLEYTGLENITERDIITFSNPETAEILGIAATDAEEKELPLPPVRYMITSNYLEEEHFEIEDSNEKWTLEADYNSNTFKITEKNK